MSKQNSLPSAGSPRAMQSELQPVNVPTSTAVRAPIAATSSEKKLPCSSLIIITLSSPSRSVSARRSRSTGSSAPERIERR